MATPDDKLRVHQGHNTVTVRVEGCAQMAQGLALRHFGTQAVTDGAAALYVDLRHCTYMDSTFMGTLVFLYRAMKEQGELALVAPSPQCLELLEQMGLDQLFPIRQDGEVPADACTEMACRRDASEAFKRNVVDAHEQLAELPGRTGETFRAVVRTLRRDGA